jgi:hypothetical protein
VDAASDSPPDAAPDASGVCNPLTQTGCASGDKCTWIVDDAASATGHVGCAPAGTVGIGGVCMNSGGVGPDDCIGGSVCVAGECKTICDPAAAVATNGCDAQHACSRYSGLFEDQGVISYGACDPACDPLTQALFGGTGNLAACGATVADSPNKGCYTFDFNVFTCAPVGAVTLTLTDRTPPRTDSGGNPFVNGCAPGFMPFFLEQTGSTRALCTGLCAPLETDNTRPQNAIGDPAALGKLPGDAAPVAGHATCGVGIKGSESPEDCLFLWSFLTDSNGQPGPSQYNDTLGVCFAFSHFTFDPGNGTQVPIPGCETLSPAEAPQFGCFTSAHSVLNLAPSHRDFRLAYGPGIAHRPHLTRAAP